MSEDMKREETGPFPSLTSWFEITRQEGDQLYNIQGELPIARIVAMNPMIRFTGLFLDNA